MKIPAIGIAVILFLVSTSCNKDKQKETDEMLIKEYIDANSLDATPTGSGLYYVINEPGNDEHPDLNSDVYFRYTGKLLNGLKFDSSNGNVVKYPLRNLIKGWQEGMPYFGKGGQGILLVPSHLGYGSQQQGVIPPNSVLVFDIELVDFD